MQPTRLRARQGQPRFQRALGVGSLCVASSTSAHRKNAIVRRFLGDIRPDLKPWRCHHTRWSTFNQDARIEVLKEPSCVKPPRWCFPPPVRATRLGKPHSRATRVRTRNLIRHSVPKPAKICAPAVTTKPPPIRRGFSLAHHRRNIPGKLQCSNYAHCPFFGFAPRMLDHRTRILR